MLSLGVFCGDSDLSVSGDGKDASPFECSPTPSAYRPPLAPADPGVPFPMPRPNCAPGAAAALGVLPERDVDFFALDGSGSSSLIKSLRGSSRGTKSPASPPDVALEPGVPCSVDEAKKSAGLLLILVAEAETLGRILPPPCGVRDLGVMSAIGLGGPADGGARIRWVKPTLYSGSGVTLGAAGMLPYGLEAPRPAPAGCAIAAPGCVEPSKLDVPRPPAPKPGAAGCVADGPGVDPKRLAPPKAGVELAAPNAGVDKPPSPGVAPKAVVAGAGELNWNDAGFGVVAAPPNENAGVDAGAAAPVAPNAGVELAPNAGVDEAPNALPPAPNAGVDDPNAGVELAAPNAGVDDPNAGVELAAPNAGVELAAPNAGVELGAPNALPPPNAGAGADDAGAPNAGAELGAPNAGAELAPKAGADEGAPNAGADVAPNALPPPNAGAAAGAAPNAGAELVPKAGVEDAPNALPPPNVDVLGAPNADVVGAGAPNAPVDGDWVPPNGAVDAGWLPNMPPVCPPIPPPPACWPPLFPAS